MRYEYETSGMETHLGSISRAMGSSTGSNTKGCLPLGERLVLGVKRGKLLSGLLLSQLIAC